MSPVIPFADVTMFGAFDPDGEVYRSCRLTMNGKPADVTLYTLRTDPDHKWVAVDRLINAKVTDNPDGSLTIVGTSQELIHVVGTDASNAEVRWEVKPKGCANCN